MNEPPSVDLRGRLRGAAKPIGIAAVAAFLIWGLYLANRPVRAPLQGQIDARYVDISPKILGRVARLEVHEGDTVSRGTSLVLLDSPEVHDKVSQARAALGAARARQQLLDNGVRAEEIRTAKATWQRANADAQLAKTTFRRINALYREGLIAQQRNDEVETAYHAALEGRNAARAQYEASMNGFRHEERAVAAAATEGAVAVVDEAQSLAADAVLKAPMAAEVDKIILQQGELAPPGFPILTLVNLDDVWAVFNMRETELSSVRIGTLFKGTVPALSGRTVAFRVYYISPKGEYATWRATRQSSGYDIKTFEVRARPTDRVEGLRPGMSVLIAWN